MMMLEMAAIKAKNDSMIMRIMLRAIHRRHKSSLREKKNIKTVSEECL